MGLWILAVCIAQFGVQLGEAISGILSDMLDRLRDRGEAASDQAARLGNRALKLGAGYGSDALARVGAQTNNALSRVSSEVEDRPLLTIGVALGIGVLIGAAILGSAAARK